ncbi:hypothetical protein BT63DRAFT_415462 [Microthyrium microscopicum]|uniref:Uncharacterized protein n=1 Tax=Microthyrium microscopicum TaxID=703497 RepID=A0A6A6U6S6_9PEZI|nr:hypothetical protein BT63DRAFT_415462 [Microthyrium microscopicum]
MANLRIQEFPVSLRALCWLFLLKIVDASNSRIVTTNGQTLTMRNHTMWSNFTRWSTEEFPDATTTTGWDCRESYLAYYTLEQSYVEMLASQSNLYTQEVRTSVFETIQALGNSTSTFKGCDGVVRVKVNGDLPLYTTRTISAVKTYLMPPSREIVLDKSNENDPRRPHEPKCSMDPEPCEHFWQEYLFERWGINAKNSHVLGSGQRRVPSRCLDAANFRQENGRNARGRGLPICQMNTGSEVLILYWPSKMSSDGDCASTGSHSSRTSSILSGSSFLVGRFPKVRFFSTTAITFQGNDIQLRTVIANNQTTIFSEKFATKSVMYGNWTFTSPTIYLAHHPITYMIETIRMHENDTLSVLGTNSRALETRAAGVIPLRPGDVYTREPIRPDYMTISGDDYVKLVAAGKYNPLLPQFMSFSDRLLNPNDLQNPVPASAYYDARFADCWGKQSHCGAITDDSFHPILSVVNGAWEEMLNWTDARQSTASESYWRDCDRPFMVDPPLLIPIEEVDDPNALAGPKAPAWAATQATPAAQHKNPDRNDVMGSSNNWRPSHPQPRPWIVAPTPTPTGKASRTWSTKDDRQDGMAGTSTLSADNRKLHNWIKNLLDPIWVGIEDKHKQGNSGDRFAQGDSAERAGRGKGYLDDHMDNGSDLSKGDSDDRRVGYSTGQTDNGHGPSKDDNNGPRTGSSTGQSEHDSVLSKGDISKPRGDNFGGSFSNGREQNEDKATNESNGPTYDTNSHFGGRGVQNGAKRTILSPSIHTSAIVVLSTLIRLIPR